MQNQKYSYALQYLNAAIHKHQNSPDLITLRAKLKDHYLKDYQGAINDYTLLIQIQGLAVPKAYYRRAKCYYNLKKYNKAIIDYSIVLKLKPDYVRVYLARANAYSQAGLKQKAIQDTLIYIKHKPRDKQGHAYLKKLLQSN